MFKHLCDLLGTRVVHGKIASNGSCFLHALEYALGNCDMIANRQDLYQKNRGEVAAFAIQTLKRQERSLVSEFNEVPRKDEEIARFYESFEKRLDFLERFKSNKEYSNEDIVQYAALFKKKILCIVEEDGENRMSLICPNIPFRKENILFLVHSNGIHYETFQYPIHVSDELVYALEHLKGVELTEYTMKLKEFTLDQLVSFIVMTRIHRRKTENRRMTHSRSMRKSSNLRTRKEDAIRRVSTFLNPIQKKENTIRIHENTSRHKLVWIKPLIHHQNLLDMIV